MLPFSMRWSRIPETCFPFGGHQGHVLPFWARRFEPLLNAALCEATHVRRAAAAKMLPARPRHAVLPHSVLVCCAHGALMLRLLLRRFQKVRSSLRQPRCAAAARRHACAVSRRAALGFTFTDELGSRTSKGTANYIGFFAAKEPLAYMPRAIS